MLAFLRRLILQLYASGIYFTRRGFDDVPEAVLAKLKGLDLLFVRYFVAESLMITTSRARFMSSKLNLSEFAGPGWNGHGLKTFRELQLCLHTTDARRIGRITP